MESLAQMFGCLGEAVAQVGFETESDPERSRGSIIDGNIEEEDPNTDKKGSDSVHHDHRKDYEQGNTCNSLNERRILEQFRMILSEETYTTEDRVKVMQKLQLLALEIDNPHNTIPMKNKSNLQIDNDGNDMEIKDNNDDGDDDDNDNDTKKLPVNNFIYIHNNFVPSNMISPITSILSDVHSEYEGREVLSATSSREHRFEEEMALKERLNTMKQLLLDLEHDIQRNQMKRNRERSYDLNSKSILSKASERKTVSSPEPEDRMHVNSIKTWGVRSITSNNILSPISERRSHGPVIPEDNTTGEQSILSKQRKKHVRIKDNLKHDENIPRLTFSRLAYNER